MRTILVTGGTGTLGRPTVAALRAAGHDVRVLSRRRGAGLTTGNLTEGTGLREAVNGVDTVLHLATSLGRADVTQTRNLVESLRPTGVEHLIFVSIVGIDRIPLPYYRHKLESERLVAESSIPYSVLRATQFHHLVDRLFSAQRFLPFLLAPAIRLQPIAIEDVAARLAALAAGPPAGRAADIGGPEQRPVPGLARVWKQAAGSGRPVISVRLPGKTFRAFASGAALAGTTPYGQKTFADHLGERFAVEGKQ
ncbi:SDR family oxidoreductase [Kribbella sp. CA-293567]|uniref:SDR family oxidoreductase n=1 Tax=Kribbella sp. CA-293567 TaxID=3002436 RepID=UPI0022DD564F|nr:NmrA family NAD(P)-binding protein [Kribbella sp. CA-293567]WBQ02184.1 NAD(P)H-binding protein [Kribbella sp. CA-293567]